jgi:hypothetical protein
MFEHFLYHLFVRYDDHGKMSRTVFAPVRCEQCGHTYGHALTRSARMFGERYFWKKPDSSLPGAQKEARRELEKKLARGVDLVPCPSAAGFSGACSTGRAANISRRRRGRR